MSTVMRIALLLTFFGSAVAAAIAAPSADELVRRSIAYHDPNGVWQRGEIKLEIVVTYSESLAAKRGAKGRELTLTLEPGRGAFGYDGKAGGEPLVVRIDGDGDRLTLGGRDEIPEADRERLRIRAPAFYRDYYEYLYGMPMKLLDPGARIEPEPTRTTLDGRDALALRVTYDPEVGSDIWTFFFDPTTSAVIGYRFQKDEAGTIGETILLGGEIVDEASGFRIPRTQAWYVLGSDEYLATDEIRSMTVDRTTD